MFNLTRQEREVILFLISVGIFGAGIDLFSKRSASVRALAKIDPDIWKLDLNTADKDSLMAVPGIGEKIAARIIEYRESHSGFREIEELRNVKGITGQRFESIKAYFKVGK